MEHVQFDFDRVKLWRIALCGCLFALLSACKEPLKEPETIDPIFQDILVDLKAAEAEYESEKKTYEEVKTLLAELPPRSPKRSRTTRELYIREARVEKFRQKIVYFELLSEKRREFARKSYLKAFKADKPWPDPAEKAEYFVNKRLRHAPKDWSTRVPKLPIVTSVKKDEGKDKKSEHGEKPPASGGH